MEYKVFWVPVAQLDLELSPSKRMVTGSNPVGNATFNKHLVNMQKEQVFIVQEFINRHATKNLWNISDKLYDLIGEIIEIEKKSNATLPAAQHDSH